MYRIERQSQILNLIEENGSINVNYLADYFHISKETIRRDLRELEQNGAIIRTHGGAITADTNDSTSPSEYPVTVRGIRNYQEKQNICKKAASFIQSGDTVFVDNSSTTIYLSQYVPPHIQVTFITNSIQFLIESAKLNNQNQLYICLGGIFKNSNLSVYGNVALDNAKKYFPNKAFLSCASISPDKMLTDSSIQEVDTKKLMIELSKEVFILADHTKFEKDGQIYLSSLWDIHHIITDSKTPVDHCSYLSNYDIDLIISD